MTESKIIQGLKLEWSDWTEKHKLKPAKDPLAVSEGEMAIGDHLKVTGLANCLGVGIVKSGISATAGHVGPFGGENYQAQHTIKDWAEHYVRQLGESISKEPEKVIVRSRTIGSRPLFHGKMIEALREQFPQAKFDIANGTELEIQIK